jgi:hypothetical protein
MSQTFFWRGVVTAFSFGIIGITGGTELTAAHLPTNRSLTQSSAFEISSITNSSGVMSGSFLPANLAAKAAPYVTTRGLTASLNPSFKKVSTNSQYDLVKSLVDAYNSASVQAKTVGVQASVWIVPQALSPSRQAPLVFGGGGGCNGWESFQFEGWDGFQWYMNQCYATGLVDQLLAGVVLDAVVALALVPLGAGAVAAGVAAAIGAAFGGAAGYIAETQSMCGSRNIWLGLHYWVAPSHGCA